MNPFHCLIRVRWYVYRKRYLYDWCIESVSLITHLHNFIGNWVSFRKKNCTNSLSPRHARLQFEFNTTPLSQLQVGVPFCIATYARLYLPIWLITILSEEKCSRSGNSILSEHARLNKCFGWGLILSIPHVGNPIIVPAILRWDGFNEIQIIVIFE